MAIIDDQADISLISPDVVAKLNPPEHNRCFTTLSTTTIQGTSQPRPVLEVDGLIVTSLDSQTKMGLGPCYVCPDLPDAIDEVPSREKVQSTPHLKHLAADFPRKSDDWKTLILIGRDCMRAQVQKQHEMEGSHRIMASKTPFGWVLIGSPEQAKRSMNSPKNGTPAILWCKNSADAPKVAKKPEQENDPIADYGPPPIARSKAAKLQFCKY